MCGRFTLRQSATVIGQALQAIVPTWEPRYNIAPTQQVLAIRMNAAGERQGGLLRWGLIPSWADDPKIGYKLINARSDTVAVKPSFRSAFKQRRCLIVADGFYEWQKVGATKQPFHIRMKDGRLFGFAGLWERWGHDDQTIESCAIITTDANATVEPVHNRMPVILPAEHHALWLDPEFQHRGNLEAMLQPYDASAMEAIPVSTAVNNPRNDKPDCLVPV